MHTETMTRIRTALVMVLVVAPFVALAALVLWVNVSDTAGHVERERCASGYVASCENVRNAFEEN